MAEDETPSQDEAQPDEELELPLTPEERIKELETALHEVEKEMLYKLRETKANLLKMTDNQLDTTTKRTIAENEQMSSELAWQVCV